jgi:hypothetical protein
MSAPLIGDRGLRRFRVGRPLFVEARIAEVGLRDGFDVPVKSDTSGYRAGDQDQLAEVKGTLCRDCGTGIIGGAPAVTIRS